MKKKSNGDLPVLQTDVLEGIPKDRVRELASNVHNLARDGFSIEKIATVLGTTPAMIAAIQRTALYQKSIHALVKDDSETFRTMLRASSSKIGHVLTELALSGNVKAIALWIKVMGIDKQNEDKGTDAMSVFTRWMEELGHKSKDQQNTEKIKALEEDVIDVDYEIEQLISETIPDSQNPLDDDDDE